MFKEKHNLETRKNEARRIKEKYPDRVPIVVEKSKNSDIKDIDKHKYLVPLDLTIAQFIFIIRKRLTLTPDKAIFIFINNTLPSTSSTLGQIYSEQKDEDGFLYILYSGESTFG